MTKRNSIFVYEIVGVRPNGFTHYYSPSGRIDGYGGSRVLSHTMRPFGFSFMNTPAELVGQKFNKLTITEVLKCNPPSTHRKVRAFCECGNKGEYLLKQLKSGKTKSCGCIKGAKPKHETPVKSK